MFCTKCGREVEDGMAFCDGCGAPLNGAAQPAPPSAQPAAAPVAEAPASAPTTQMPAQAAPAAAPAAQAPAPQQGGKKSNKGLIAAIAVLAVAVIAAGVAAFVFLTPAKTYAVPITVNAAGLDTTTGSKIPLHVTGTTYSEKTVDKVYYVGTDTSSDSDFQLESGDYNFSIEVSPIAEDGTMYDTSNVTTTVTVGEEGDITTGSELTLPQKDPLDITDEEKQKAFDALEESGLGSDKVQQLEQVVEDKITQAKEEQKAAEEAAKKAAEEAAAKKAAEEAAAKEAAEKAAAAKDTSEIAGTWFISGAATAGAATTSLTITSSGSATMSGQTQGQIESSSYSVSKNGSTYTFSGSSSFTATYSGGLLTTSDGFTWARG